MPTKGNDVLKIESSGSSCTQPHYWQPTSEGQKMKNTI